MTPSRTFAALRANAARFSASLAKSHRKHGILGTFRTAVYNLRLGYREWQFDRRLGVDTRGTVGFVNRERILQGIQSDKRRGVTGFGPCDPAAIVDVLGSLNIRHEDYVFVDVGSGKGRVILIASDWPFKKVVGVELSRELHEKALENIRNRRGSPPRCGSIESVSMDATQFPLPSGPVCLFLNNPIHLEEVMEKFLSNVERCWRESPRPIWVLYVNPILESVFEKFSLFERVPAPRHYYSLHRTPSSAAEARPKARASQIDVSPPPSKQLDGARGELELAGGGMTRFTREAPTYETFGQECMTENAKDSEGLSGAVPRVPRRKPLRLSEEDLVRMEPLRGDGPLPLVATPAVGGVDLVSWAERHRELLRSRLTDNGAILFRGFEIGGIERFEEFIGTVAGPLLEYKYGSTPRTHVSGNIYTSTEYPAHQEIPLHNEMSYSSDWPMKIWFLCIQPAREGGETPIADSRRVFERIEPALRDRMNRNGVLYVRNYGEGLDVPWQQVFQTEDRERVEEFCRGAGISWEWREGDRLRTREVCQATQRHPLTGEMVWFNQAHLFHISNVSPETRAQLLESYGQENLPRNAYYGDGSPFEEGELEQIRRAYQSESIVFPWQAGDIVMVDNMLTAHARKPYSGARRVVVGMAESWQARAEQVDRSEKA